MSIVMATIDKFGLFWYTPNRWTDELTDEISRLVNDDVIENIRSAGISFMNGNYCYIKKGNPDNARVERIDCNNKAVVTDKGGQL